MTCKAITAITAWRVTIESWYIIAYYAVHLHTLLWSIGACVDKAMLADGAPQNAWHAATAQELLKPWLNSNGQITGLPAEALEHVSMFLRWRLAQALPDDDLVEYARQRVESTRKQWQNAHVIRKVQTVYAGVVHVFWCSSNLLSRALERSSRPLADMFLL